MLYYVRKHMSVEKPLRILVIAPTPFFSDRGCHIRINEECQALQSLGHTIKIVTYGLGKDVPGLDIERIHHFESYTKTSAGPSFFKIFLDSLLCLRTRSALRRFKPDIIHAHLHEGAYIAWGARLLSFSRAPILFDAQGSLVSEMRGHMSTAPQWFFKLMHTVEHWTFRMAKSVVVSSESLLKLITDQRLSPPRTPVILAADSANRVPVLSESERYALRTEHEIPADARVLMYCGGMTADKGVDILYDAIAPLMKADSSLYMVWIGGPEEVFRTRAEQDSLIERMRFFGYQPFAETHRLSQLGDVAIDPKPPTSSQASGKMLNYMAIALPIITFDSANRTMIDPENFFAAPATVEGLRSAITDSLTKNREELHALGKKNAAYLDAHFSWETTAEVLDSVYRAMLKPRA